MEYKQPPGKRPAPDGAATNVTASKKRKSSSFFEARLLNAEALGRLVESLHGVCETLEIKCLPARQLKIYACGPNQHLAATAVLTELQDYVCAKEFCIGVSVKSLNTIFRRVAKYNAIRICLSTEEAAALDISSETPHAEAQFELRLTRRATESAEASCFEIGCGEPMLSLSLPTAHRFCGMCKKLALWNSSSDSALELTYSEPWLELSMCDIDATAKVAFRPTSVCGEKAVAPCKFAASSLLKATSWQANENKKAVFVDLYVKGEAALLRKRVGFLFVYKKSFLNLPSTAAGLGYDMGIVNEDLVYFYMPSRVELPKSSLAQFIAS
ncbi:MAG: hypothetical protein E6Q06_01840 [Candidatus Moraniibacteriota bacterium]|nr:MAG: hypothetical protein E6Q06_01840 [Candidatus Moranbacteria bacterium]